MEKVYIWTKACSSVPADWDVYPQWQGTWKGVSHVREEAQWTTSEHLQNVVIRLGFWFFLDNLDIDHTALCLPCVMDQNKLQNVTQES